MRGSSSRPASRGTQPALAAQARRRLGGHPPAVATSRALAYHAMCRKGKEEAWTGGIATGDHVRGRGVTVSRAREGV